MRAMWFFRWVNVSRLSAIVTTGEEWGGLWTYLYPLHLAEGFRKFTLRISQAVNTVAQQYIHRRIQGETVEQRINSDFLSLAAQKSDQLLHVRLKKLQIRDPAFHKLRPNQLPATMPEITIRREDAVPQEIFPILMKGLALAIVTELRGKDSLDVLRLRRENEALASK